jgi:hypothetical protein
LGTRTNAEADRLKSLTQQKYTALLALIATLLCQSLSGHFNRSHSRYDKAVLQSILIKRIAVNPDWLKWPSEDRGVSLGELARLTNLSEATIANGPFLEAVMGPRRK